MNTNSLSLLRDLRLREGLTQADLARELRLTENDISRMEGTGNPTLEKYEAAANRFGIPCDTLIRNDFPTAYAVLFIPMEEERDCLDSHMRRMKAHKKAGNEGERWVYEWERQKLAGTKYYRMVDLSPSENIKAGYDIRSCDPDGVPIFIEVKTTADEMEKEFYMSSFERRKAIEFLEKGLRYEVHRVFHLNDPKRRGREIITGEALLGGDFIFTPKDYIVSRKEDISYD